jgi:phosphomannomutase
MMTANAHRFDPSVFREYDIRGIAGGNLRAEDVYRIAGAFAAKVAANGGTSICVGRDGRLSSPELADSACKAIADSGLDVIDIGLGPTPMLYFAAKTQAAGGGIMITGSHNPPDYNGMKFMFAGGAFYGADIQSLAQPAPPSAKTKGIRHKRDINTAYIDKLLATYDGNRLLKTAWDAGNGATGNVMAALCGLLPGQHLAINATIDGTFPVHHPDPTVPENLKQLIGVVKERGLDAGIAFDGDGDRLGVIDDEGEILWGDQLLMLYAADILRNMPGATIIADIKASGALFEEIERLGGKPLMWKTGHSLIKSKMAETGAPLAGEMSGHLFFADRYYGYDDALYAAVRLLGLLSRSNRKLSDLRKALPQRITRRNCVSSATIRANSPSSPRSKPGSRNKKRTSTPLTACG